MSAEPVDVYPRRWVRVWTAATAIGGAVVLGICAWTLISGERVGAMWLLCVVMGLNAVIRDGRQTIVFWRHPLLRLGPDEIAWRPPGSKEARRLAVAEVTGFRWPLPKDLWIESARGETLQIAMIGISEADRGRVRAWLGERWADGGFRTERRAP